MNYNEMYNLVDMLRGEINRMCITDDMKELDNLRLCADLNISKLFDMNVQRLEEEKHETE